MPNITILPLFPTDYMDGLSLGFNTVSLVDIGIGRCKDSSGLIDISALSVLTVNLATSGVANGLDAGSEAADTWYAVYIIIDPTGVNPVAALLSLNATSPALPSGYSAFRRLGWVRNNPSSDIIDFQQHGEGTHRRYFYLNSVDERFALSGGSATTPTLVDLSTLIPVTSFIASLGIKQNAANKIIEIFQNTTGKILTRLSNEREIIGTLPLDDNQSIAYQVTTAGGDTDIDIIGWMEGL